METILKVLSNLNHNGTHYTAGTFFKAERAQFEALIADGVIKACEDVETVAEAMEQDARELAHKAAVEAGEADAEDAANTWGPKPETAPEAPAETTEVSEVQTTTETAPADTTVAPGAVGEGDLPPADTTAATTPEETGENL
jgi:hypothetical protein